MTATRLVWSPAAGASGEQRPPACRRGRRGQKAVTGTRGAAVETLAQPICALAWRPRVAYWGILHQRGVAGRAGRELPACEPAYASACEWNATSTASAAQHQLISR